MKIKYSLIAAALLFSASVALAGSGTNGTAEENATAYEEARTRISPIIVELDPNRNIRYCGFSAGEDYNITYKVMGYEENMDTYMTFYDCDGINEFECGKRYGSPEKVVESEWVEASSVTHEDWTYTDAAGTTVPAYVSTYTAVFTMSDNGTDDNPWSANENGTGGDQLAVRWWQKADDAEGKSVSLLIGVEATRHYGENMRRVGTKTSSNLDPDDVTCVDK